MATREPGRFRTKVFGGFNREDVLNYIKSIYSELDQAYLTNEDLRQRCIELENLIQNLHRDGTNPDPVVHQVRAYVTEPTPQQPIPLPDPVPYEPEPISAMASKAPNVEPALTAAPTPPPGMTFEPTATPTIAPAPPAAPAPSSKPSLATPPTGSKATRIKVRRIE